MSQKKFAVGDMVKYYKSEEDFLPVSTSKITAFNVSPEREYLYQLDGSLLVEEKQLRRAYTHISPSALRAFEDNISEFYYRYVARHKPPSLPQNQPMSIGSAFDAYAKSHILKTLARGNPVEPKYEFENLFKAQVEPQNREWALEAGKYAFQSYKDSGALADLMLEITQGDKSPRFEFEMRGQVTHDGLDVPMTGKPDLYYNNKHAAHVVNDWKVNGFCSNSGVSPKAGYVMCRDSWDHTVAAMSKTHRKSHKDCQAQMIQGIECNIATPMDQIDKDWATQLTVYAWLMGQPVGSAFIAGIEQLACMPGGPNGRPLIRVASYRGLISKNFQLGVYERFKKCWSALSTGYFFPELPRAESDAKCFELEKMAKTLNPTGDDREDWFNNLNRVR